MPPARLSAGTLLRAAARLLFSSSRTSFCRVTWLTASFAATSSRRRSECLASSSSRLRSLQHQMAHSHSASVCVCHTHIHTHTQIICINKNPFTVIHLHLGGWRDDGAAGQNVEGGYLFSACIACHSPVPRLIKFFFFFFQVAKKKFSSCIGMECKSFIVCHLGA